MFSFFKAHYIASVIALVVILGVIFMIVTTVTQDQNANLVTGMVDTGIVSEIIAVSGVINAFNTAELGFPSAGGIVSEVLVIEGSEVKTGDVLASLASASLLADRSDALASLRLAEADYNELLAGPRNEARFVTAETLAASESNLQRTIENQEEAVAAAKRTYLSSSLTALSLDSSEEAVAPVITGTYRCETEGEYIIDFYSSAADSGYSYRLSGLETDTNTAFATQPSPLGNCGLFMQINSGDRYGNTKWSVSIPNKNSPLYVTNNNALAIAEETAQSQIEAATKALAIAKAESSLSNAEPRSEEVVRAEARVSQARARLANIDASIKDRSIFAPFDGVVTTVDILKGETAGTAPVITILATDSYEIDARVPEIDITKITESDKAVVVFDARADEPLNGTVQYISPLPTEIDGVAYFETKIKLDTEPSWLRSGLNADVDIIIAKVEDAVRAPRRFVQEDESGESYVIVLNGNQTTNKYVDVVFTGNDGYVALEGVSAGTTIVAP